MAAPSSRQLLNLVRTSVLGLGQLSGSMFLLLLLLLVKMDFSVPSADEVSR